MLRKNVQHKIEQILQKGTVGVIGTGGVGAWILAFLGRASRNKSFERPRIDCYEADVVEEKNLERQLFGPRDIGRNKGSALAVTLEKFSDIAVIREYIHEKNVNLLEDDSVIFMCVDNHATRKLVSDHCQTLRNVILISGGNELWDGTVQVYVRINRADITPPLTFGHPEIEEPTDEGPWSCGDMGESEPQIAATNIMVAANMMAAYWMLNSDKLWHELHFDLLEGKSDSFDFWESKRKKKKQVDTLAKVS